MQLYFVIKEKQRQKTENGIVMKTHFAILLKIGNNVYVEITIRNE